MPTSPLVQLVITELGRQRGKNKLINKTICKKLRDGAGEM
jgi:hypothetical protein